MAAYDTFRVDILTKVSRTLKILQQIYPGSRIINLFLTLFEKLNAYAVLDSESRTAVATSGDNILRELANIKATLQPYLNPADQNFSEEDLNTINELLDFDPDKVLEILEHKHKQINEKSLFSSLYFIFLF
jgi:hypothetical protein